MKTAPFAPRLPALVHLRPARQPPGPGRHPGDGRPRQPDEAGAVRRARRESEAARGRVARGSIQAQSLVVFPSTSLARGSAARVPAPPHASALRGWSLMAPPQRHASAWWRTVVHPLPPRNRSRTVAHRATAPEPPLAGHHCGLAVAEVIGCGGVRWSGYSERSRPLPPRSLPRPVNVWPGMPSSRLTRDACLRLGWESS